MAEYRFLVDSVEASTLVTGRNEAIEIPLGTTFTGIAKIRVDGDPMHLHSVDLGVVATVHLTLKQVIWYGRSIDLVPGGHSAGLKVEGEGLSVLVNALKIKATRECIFLVAPLPPGA